MDPLRIGISTCPNDTFAFDSLLRRVLRVEVPGESTPRELHFELDDVQALNEAAARRSLDVVKLSFATLLDLPRDWVLLRSGSALGFGVGPVVLRRKGAPTPAIPRVALPGAGTTAALLWRIFHPEPFEPVLLRFDRIMPALLAGQVDLGVCIHEGRFTYARQGLECLEDLGTTWEQATGLPLPLGGIAARAELGDGLISAVDRALQASIAAALREPEGALPTMRRYAAEFDDAVLFEHVRLYVNPTTVQLDATALEALAELARRAGKPALRVASASKDPK